MDAKALIQTQAAEHLDQARAMAAEKWPQARADQREDLARHLAQAMAQTAMQDEHRSILRESERVREMATNQKRAA